MDDSDAFDISTSESDISDMDADTGNTGFDVFDDITTDDISEMLDEAEDTGTHLDSETDGISEGQEVSEKDLSGSKDIEIGSSELSNEMNEDLSEAEKAADYARSLGFEKAGDYIENHYNGEMFDPSGPIPITTRNAVKSSVCTACSTQFRRTPLCIGKKHSFAPDFSLVMVLHYL